jgi:stage V sporulation protein B
MATSLALAGAALVGAFMVKTTAGSFAPPKTLVRTALALGAAISAGYFMPWMGRVFVPLQAAAVAAVYLAVAIALGELTRADLATIGAVLGRKRG